MLGRSLIRSYGRRKFVWIFPALMLVNTFFFYGKFGNQNGGKNSNVTESRITDPGARHLQSSAVIDCIPHAIEEFPGDFFTQDERVQGGVVIHFIIGFYLFAILAIVCDDYFIPSLEVITDTLKVPTDVAGATFMAIGTSSPELFSSIIGVFITEGDIGIGTIVGSAVFNILGVTSLAGLAVWNNNVPVDWYPITRDSSMYTLTVLALVLVIYDNIVRWWEALILVLLFVCYIIIMYFNTKIEIFSTQKMAKLRGKSELKEPQPSTSALETNEKTPLLWKDPGTSQSNEDLFQNQIPIDDSEYEFDQTKISTQNQSGDHRKNAQSQRSIEKPSEEEPDSSICLMPYNNSCKQIWWVIMWPASLLMFLTIPDCKKDHIKKYFVVTFIMSVIWIGGISYLCVWMVTIIAYTLYIPDTVAGITLLAIGTSVPEVISSVIVVRNGLGNMAICNLLGSNIFDILFCLGMPWLVKSLAFSETGYVVINSSALTYTSITLLTTVLLLYGTFYFSKWNLNFKVGITCMCFYAAFLTLSCLYELNVFGEINLPSCLRLD